MRIDQYEGRIKRYVNADDKNTVTLRQLRYSFQEDQTWSDLQDDTSMLYRLFNSPELFDEEQPDKLNVIKLICLGLMLCGGTYELKARVLYDVLQDNMQPKISSNDKDFVIAFTHLVVLSSYMMLRIYREESGSPYVTEWYPQPKTQRFDNVLEEMREGFLDEIFDSSSNMTREQFLQTVTQRQPWIFESEEVRKRWNMYCEQKREEEEEDKKKEALRL